MKNHGKPKEIRENKRSETNETLRETKRGGGVHRVEADVLADLEERGCCAMDCLVGIAAGGTTPYVRGGLAFAKSIGNKLFANRFLRPFSPPKSSPNRFQIDPGREKTGLRTKPVL